jgi:5S rRNA maturation endonuclease (ribonuclease M5)
MTVHELLGRLERVSKSSDGWRARCPGHDDAKPSLSVATADDGRILLRCFAGCDVERIVDALGLELRDLFAASGEHGAGAAGTPRGAVVPAGEMPPVAAWLRDARALPPGEIARLFAASTKTGSAVVFRYRGLDGTVLYDKFRPIGDHKVFWRMPRGQTSALYGLGDLAGLDRSRVVIVEGELDVHALAAAGITGIVSVPDGAGSRLTSELLAPLAEFERVLIATDADDPGEELARRLRHELGARRCARVVLQDGGARFKDANDALKAGWTGDQFEAALQTPSRGKASSPPSAAASVPVMVEGGEETTPYRLIDGQICRIRHDREGNELTQVLANFDARIVDEVAYDDGAEVVRAFKLRGRLASGVALADARVTAAEFGGMSWVASAWGARALVSAGNGAKDHLRAAIQVLSEPSARLVFRHTGWRQQEGRWVYLYQGGGVGAEHLTVELDPPLDRFVLPPAVDDLVGAVSLSLHLLDCAPASVAVPLLASVYAAPLSFIMSPDFAVWLVGPTGSLKSELAALAQRHFGTFDRKTLPGSWTSTENALEARLFTVKDAVAVIDDYAPNADTRAQQELEKRAQRIIRGIGNRASRGRLRADLTQQPDRPPRGLVICTGEDLPTGHSIQARLVIVEVERERLDLSAIAELQASNDRLSHAMRGYIEWLQPEISQLQSALPARLGRIRAELQRVGSHLRQADALAQLRLAFEMFVEFAEHVGALDAARAAELLRVAGETLCRIGEAQGTTLKDLEPAERFVTVLGTLLEQRRIRLVERGTSPRSDDVEAIGWFDTEYAYLLPEAARRRVATFLRESGESWSYSGHALHKALVRKGIVVPGPDHRPEMQVRVGDGKRRVLRVRLSALNGGAGVPDFVPGLSPVFEETGDRDDDSNVS